MKIVDNKSIFKTSKRMIFILMLVFFIGGFLLAAYASKNAKMSYLSLNSDYIKKTGLNFITNAIEADSDGIETYYLDVKFKEWRKLADQRNSIWNYSNMIKSRPFQWNDSIEKVEIKGKIRLDNAAKKVKLKLVGLNFDHFAEPKKWSFRISIKGDNTIDRQKKFNLLIPRSRGYVNDFVGQNYLKELDLISLRTKPVKLVLNGDDLGIYYKEEFYDKRLIEHNNFRESAIIRLNNYDIDISIGKYEKYKTIIDKFQAKIDLVKTNKAEVSELFDIDKMADRIALSLLFGDYHSLIDFNQRYYLNPFTAKLEPLGREWHFVQYTNEANVYETIEYIKNTERALYKSLFNDDSFLKKLNNSINAIASDLFQKRMDEKYLKSVEGLKKVLYSEYVFFETPLSLIANNATILKRNKTWIKPSAGKNQLDKLSSLTNYARVSNDTILIDKSISIKEKIHIPAGYKIIIKPGVNIIFENNGQILSESPFIALGTVNDSIQFKAKAPQNNNGGMLFLNTKGSQFKYVKFKNLSNYSDDFRTLPGSVCFYESSVSFSNTTFDTSYGGDDLLNIVRSEFSIANSELLNSKADALDSDFSNGIITNTVFKNIGNDAIDVSGTKLDISNITINEIEDKGISVGEDSHITGKNITITNSSLALTSKDLSTLSLDGVQVDNCDVVFTVFEKKSEYGPALINCQNATFTNYKEEYLVQFNNALIVNLNEIKIKVKDVESQLYGAIYGKSSK
nr:CotH kinase family protein [uncultured Psychroserpens sp.]